MPPSITPPARSPLGPGSVVAGAYTVRRLERDGPLWAQYSVVRQGDEGAVFAAFRLTHSALVQARQAQAFVREIETLATIRHPALPIIVGASLDRNVPTVVTETLARDSLATFLATEGPQPAHVVAGMLATVADALDLMHAQRPVVAFRALSPARILWRGRGPKAQLLGAGFEHALRASRLEIDGESLRAPPSYRSPEEDVTAWPLNGAMDQFTLAAIAFECLTGRAPFSAEEEVAQREARAPARPSPSESAPGVPFELDAVIQRALSPFPLRRFNSCGAFVAEFARVAERARGVQPLPFLRDEPAAPEGDRARATWRGVGGLNPSGSLPALSAEPIARAPAGEGGAASPVREPRGTPPERPGSRAVAQGPPHDQPHRRDTPPVSTSPSLLAALARGAAARDAELQALEAAPAAPPVEARSEAAPEAAPAALVADVLVALSREASTPAAETPNERSQALPAVTPPALEASTSPATSATPAASASLALGAERPLESPATRAGSAEPRPPAPAVPASPVATTAPATPSVRPQPAVLPRPSDGQAAAASAPVPASVEATSSATNVPDPADARPAAPRRMISEQPPPSLRPVDVATAVRSSSPAGSRRAGLWTGGAVALGVALGVGAWWARRGESPLGVNSTSHAEPSAASSGRSDPAPGASTNSGAGASTTASTAAATATATNLTGASAGREPRTPPGPNANTGESGATTGVAPTHGGAASASNAAPPSAVPAPATSATPSAPAAAIAARTAGPLLQEPTAEQRQQARDEIAAHVTTCVGQFGAAHERLYLQVTYQGASGRVIGLWWGGPGFARHPITPCVLDAVRATQLPPFRATRWVTRYSFLVE